MPVFQLPDEPLFPRTSLAEPSGLLAVGGDLSPRRLVQAYAQGIFPWFSEGDPIMWHAPAQRMVLPLERLRVNRSTRKALRKAGFSCTFDSAFERVIAACARISRPAGDGTWITSGMQQGYVHLHELGLCHSVEIWLDGQLVGGLYGVSLGAIFFGESMFSKVANASKAALIELVTKLRKWRFELIDCQVHTRLLGSLGAFEVPRSEFEEMLRSALRQPTRQGTWRA